MKKQCLIVPDVDGIIRNKERYYMIAWKDPKTYGQAIGRDYATMSAAERAAGYYMRAGQYSSIIIRHEQIIKRGPDIELSADGPKKEIYCNYYAERIAIGK